MAEDKMVGTKAEEKMEKKEEKKSIFRQTALDRVTSPEDMNSYLQVTGPSTWLIMAAIIILIVGFIVWAFLGELETDVRVPVVSKEGAVICLIPEDRMDSFNQTKGQTIKIGDEEYGIRDGGMAISGVSVAENAQIAAAGGFTQDTIVQPMFVDGQLPEGVYTGDIVVETISPISFILN